MNAVTRKQVTVLCEVMTTVDRLYKNVEVALTRNLQTVNCEVLTESVYTLQDTSGCSDKEPTDVIVWGTDREGIYIKRQQWMQWHGTNRLYCVKYCQTNKECTRSTERSETEQRDGTVWSTDKSGQTVQEISGRSDTEQTDCTKWVIYRQWTDCTRHQWKQLHRTNRLHNVRYWQTVHRLYKTPVEAMSQNQQIAQREILTDIGQIVQDTSGRSDTEPTDCTKWGTDRQWT